MIIYLDNNATTPLAPKVADAMCRCLKFNFGNPSSSHPHGQKAKSAVEKARQQVAGLVGSRSDEIIFTSGGTEANNMAIIGTALRYKTGHIISSCIEHPSVLNPLKHLEGLGYKVTYLPVDQYGIVDPADVEKSIRRNTRLITVMHSNNETGSLQPIASIGRIVQKQNIIFHCDAAQSVGKVPMNVKRLNIDLLTIVSHKFYGPKGIGALYIKSGTELKPVLYGASHERGLRPGTENVAGIVGLGMACEIAKKELPDRVQDMNYLSKLFYDGLRKQIPGLKLNGHPSKRLPNTLNLSFPDIKAAALLQKLQNQVAASLGSACHADKCIPSHVLKATGVSDKDAASAVRFSLGRTNSEAQVRRAVREVVKVYRILCS